MSGYILVFFILTILVSIFALQNAGPVVIKFLIWTVPEIPLVMVILGTALIGFVAGIFIGCCHRKKVEHHSEQQQQLDNNLSKT